jgi:hypothetical protein
LEIADNRGFLPHTEDEYWSYDDLSFAFDDSTAFPLAKFYDKLADVAFRGSEVHAVVCLEEFKKCG